MALKAAGGAPSGLESEQRARLGEGCVEFLVAWYPGILVSWYPGPRLTRAGGSKIDTGLAWQD